MNYGIMENGSRGKAHLAVKVSNVGVGEYLSEHRTKVNAIELALTC